MKKAFYIFCLFPFLCTGQPDFQKIYQVGIGSSDFLSLEEYNNQIFALGRGFNVDSIQGLFIYKIDTFGNVLNSLEIIDTSTILTTYDFYTDIIFFEEETFVIGSRIDSANSKILIKSDVNLEEYEIFDFFIKEDSIEFEGFTKQLITDDAIYITGTEQILDLTTNGLLYKLDRDENVVWRKTYGVPGMDERFLNIIKASENVLILGGHRTNDYNIFSSPPDEVHIFNYLVAIDTAGNILWEWQNPNVNEQYVGGLLDMVLKKDTLYFISQYFYQDFSGPVLDFDYEPYIGAVTLGQELLWETSLPFDYGRSLNLSFNKDSSSLIASSIPPSRNKYFHTAIDLDGNLIYARSDTICSDSTYTMQWYGLLIDMITLPSGSVVSCGYANSYEESRGWLERAFLIKTNPTGLPDSSYCGWEETVFPPPTSTTETKAFKPQLLIYPNPATDVVFVEMPDGNSLGIDKIQVFSADGRLVLSQPINQEKKVVIPVSGLFVGVYTFQFMKSEGIITSKQVVVHH